MNTFFENEPNCKMRDMIKGGNADMPNKSHFIGKIKLRLKHVINKNLL